MAVKHKGMGRGLEALIQDDEEQEPQVVEKIVEVEKVVEKVVEKPADVFLKVNDIEPNRDQPRRTFEEEPLQELADSIKQYGVIEPLIVSKKDDHYEIIAGERRWRAAKLAGLKEVPVVIREYSDQQEMEVALIENLQRVDLNPIEEALGYQRLIDEHHLKQEEVAVKVSKSRSAITNAMRLLKLDERVQKMLTGNLITGGHARALLSLEDGDEQYKLATKIYNDKLSVREVEALVKTTEAKPSKPKAKKVPDDDYIYRDCENRLKEIIGTKVTIHNKEHSKGKIEIEYYSQDDFERILELFKAAKQ